MICVLKTAKLLPGQIREHPETPYCSEKQPDGAVTYKMGTKVLGTHTKQDLPNTDNIDKLKE